MKRFLTTLTLLAILLPITARSQDACRVGGNCEATNFELEIEETVTVPVVVHVVTDDDGTTGAVSMQEIDDQMAVFGTLFDGVERPFFSPDRLALDLCY